MEAHGACEISHEYVAVPDDVVVTVVAAQQTAWVYLDAYIHPGHTLIVWVVHVVVQQPR